jgi:hypothetical protein
MRETAVLDLVVASQQQKDVWGEMIDVRYLQVAIRSRGYKSQMSP